MFKGKCKIWKKVHVLLCWRRYCSPLNGMVSDTPMSYLAMDPYIQLYLPFLPSNHGPPLLFICSSLFVFHSFPLLFFPLIPLPSQILKLQQKKKPYFCTSLNYLSHLQSPFYSFSIPPSPLYIINQIHTNCHIYLSHIVFHQLEIDKWIKI